MGYILLKNRVFPVSSRPIFNKHFTCLLEEQHFLVKATRVFWVSHTWPWGLVGRPTKWGGKTTRVKSQVYKIKFISLFLFKIYWTIGCDHTFLVPISKISIRNRHIVLDVIKCQTLNWECLKQKSNKYKRCQGNALIIHYILYMLTSILSDVCILKFRRKKYWQLVKMNLEYFKTFLVTSVFRKNSVLLN